MYARLGGPMLVWDETLPFSATHVSKMLYRPCLSYMWAAGYFQQSGGVERG
jgi:hypothetical protein